MGRGGGWGVATNGLGGAKAGDAGRCVGEECAVLEEDLSTLDGRKVKAGERSAAGRIVEAGGFLS